MSLDPTHIPDQPYDSEVVNRAGKRLDAVPESVGPYRILERIGTGGMGEVYRSEQRTPIRREVALKRIKLGMDTRRIIATGVAFTLLLFAVIGTVYGFRRTTFEDSAGIDVERKASEIRDQDSKERGTTNETLDEKTVAGIAEASRRDFAERKLVDGILRPIGYSDEPDSAELLAFVNWSALDDDRLKFKVLEVAFDNPDSAVRIARSASRAMQACVALSPKRRSLALKLLAEKQRDKDIDPGIRFAACRLTIELGSTDIPAVDESIEFLSGPANKLTTRFFEFTDTLRNANLEAHQVSLCCDAFIKVLERAADEESISAARVGLSAVVRRLPLTEVPRVWDTLLYVVVTASDESVLHAAGEAMLALVLRLEVGQVTLGWDSLIKLLEGSTNEAALGAARDTLAALGPRLAAEEVHGKVDATVAVLASLTNEYAIRAACTALASLAPRLDPLQITAGWDAFIRVIRNSEEYYALDGAELGLSSFVPRLQSQQVPRCWDALIERLKNSDHWAVQRSIESVLLILVPRMERQHFHRSADPLIDLLEKRNDRATREAVCNVLAVLALEPEPKRDTRNWNAAIRSLRARVNGNLQEAAAKALEAVVRRLEPGQIDQKWTEVMEILQTTSEFHAANAAGSVLIAIVPRLAQASVASNAEKIVELLEKTDNRSSLRAAGNVLVALAARLEQEQLMRGWDALVEVLHHDPEQHDTVSAGMTLVALVPEIDLQQVIQRGDEIIDLLGRSSDRQTDQMAARIIVAMAPHLERHQVTHAWTVLIELLESPNEPFSCEDLGIALVSLVPELEPEEVSVCWDTLIQIIGTEIDSNACEAAGTAIVALAARVDSQRRADAIAGLKGMISRFSHSTSAPKHVTEIALQFDALAINRHCGDVMTSLLEWNALRGEYFTIDDLNGVCQFDSTVMAFTDRRAVATLLLHPGCTGKLREHLVKRFEELIFHDGEHVLLTLLESGSGNTGMAGAELAWGTPNRSPIEPTLRRFHTVHDAAAWIQRNWPDFDLEATHPVTWRGER